MAHMMGLGLLDFVKHLRVVISIRTDDVASIAQLFQEKPPWALSTKELPVYHYQAMNENGKTSSDAYLTQAPNSSRT